MVFYAEFERTSTGRIKRNVAGRCFCPGPGLEHFPQSMWDGQSKENPHGELPVFTRQYIWPDFGKVCPKWKPAESLHAKCFPLGAT